MPTILITGATDGLGLALAHHLEGEGHTVLYHGRDPRRLADAARGARTYRADFTSLAQVDAMAAAVLDREAGIDVLINNAGIGTTVPPGGRMLSADGHELRFAVNYLAGYLLTRRLQPIVTGRIVHVASAGQQAIDFDNVMLEHGYTGTRAYCQSKLAQIMFTFELAREGATATALHPATYMRTKIVPSPISTIEEGVRATARLAVDPALDGVTGVYFNGLREQRADPQAYDEAARRRLLELSARLTGA